MDKQIYSNLINIIISKGIKYDKKHGNWVILRLFGDYFLELDSWNKCIKCKVGSGEYNYYTGFNGKLFKYLGIDFGGFSYDAFWVNYFLAHC